MLGTCMHGAGCRYASVCAMESPSKVDDEQWLSYWIIYSFITLLEMLAEPLLYWIPVWYPVKLLFVAWLVLPQFKGASFIYEKFVREQLSKYRIRYPRKGNRVLTCGVFFLSVGWGKKF